MIDTQFMCLITKLSRKLFFNIRHLVYGSLLFYYLLVLILFYIKPMFYTFRLLITFLIDNIV